MNRHYAYLYDDFLSDRAYDRVLANIETRCSILGIQGRTARLAIFRSARDLVEGLVRDGAETIVVVGNDHSLQKVMWFLPDLPVTVGYIPVCEPSSIGGLLGIPQGDAACDVLAARRMETLDVGTIDDRYFLTEAVIEATKAAVDIEGRYRIAPRQAGRVSVRNLGSMSKDGRSSADARDGLLEVVITPIMEQATVTRRFPFMKALSPQEPETRLTLAKGSIQSNEPVDIVVDGHRVNGFAFRLGVLPRKLKIVTGRDKKLDPTTAASGTNIISDLPKTPSLSMIANRFAQRPAILDRMPIIRQPSPEKSSDA
jgi:diacylglycerol kinase family enzyme